VPYVATQRPPLPSEFSISFLLTRRDFVSFLFSSRSKLPTCTLTLFNAPFQGTFSQTRNDFDLLVDLSPFLIPQEAPRIFPRSYLQIVLFFFFPEDFHSGNADPLPPFPSHHHGKISTSFAPPFSFRQLAAFFSASPLLLAPLLSPPFFFISIRADSYVGFLTRLPSISVAHTDPYPALRSCITPGLTQMSFYSPAVIGLFFCLFLFLPPFPPPPSTDVRPFLISRHLPWWISSIL